VTTVETCAAGASADEQAELFDGAIAGVRSQLATLQEALKQLRRARDNYRVGASGERATAARVQQVLIDLGAGEWHLLADRRWPGTTSANLDLLLVGPPGVAVMDVKTWREPTISGGSLWRGQANADDEVAKVRRMADDVAELLGRVGLAPSAVVPMIVLADRHLPAVSLGDVTVVGSEDLQTALVRLGRRLDPDQVRVLVEHLDEHCPPATVRQAPRRRHARPELPTQQQLDGIWDAAVEAASGEPIESWMVWLHPEQSGLVGRAYSGPARVRGPAGTGKTVVALHRARHLARRPGARVLVTSYVASLPKVQRALFARLAPELGDRVEFVGIHAWAVRLLRGRGHRFDLAGDGGRGVFEQVWRATDVTLLTGSGLDAGYVWDEVQHVVKGRAISDLDQYVALRRVGRRTRLRREQRELVWTLRLAYDEALTARGQLDFADVLAHALESLRAEPQDPAYTAVLVDEVQDLTCVGLRLAHAIAGDGPDALLLVGDGQQAVYPGGFTAAEAGVPLAGRATVLRRNYRNAASVLDAAWEVVSADSFHDLDDAAQQPGTRDVAVARAGGNVARVRADDSRSLRAALLTALDGATRRGVRTGDMALLVPDNRSADRWLRSLEAAGVAAELLKDYDGRPGPQVKVGTYQRAKGLEFACVFLPDWDRGAPERHDGESDEAWAERAELARRQLFVAMTRARDWLWLGSRARSQSPQKGPDSPTDAKYADAVAGSRRL
jgi:superfamily I DNA/RNA helicase